MFWLYTCQKYKYFYVWYISRKPQKSSFKQACKCGCAVKITQEADQSKYIMQRSLFWCFHLSNWLDLLYGPYSLVENYYYDFFQEFEDNPTSIDRDRTLSVLIKQWICVTFSKNWRFCLFIWLSLLCIGLKYKAGNDIIFSKKFQSNPFTIDRATGLSVRKKHK